MADRLPPVPEGGFKDEDDFAAWLKNLPEEHVKPFAQVLAHRASLRVLPNLNSASSADIDTTAMRSSVVLLMIRAAISSWVALKFPEHQTRRAAHSASNSAASITLATAASIALSVVATASRSAASAQIALAQKTVALAAQSAARSNHTSALYDEKDAKSLWHAQSRDAGVLASGTPPLDIMATPLWFDNDIPDWWTESKQRFQDRLELLDQRTMQETGEPGRFSIWLEWYNAIAQGRPPWSLPKEDAWQLERRIGLGDGRGDDFWQREPGEINREIAGWVEEARSKIKKSEETREATELTQRPSAFVFNADESGITATPFQETSDIDPALCEALWAEMLEKLKNTRARLMATQAPRHVIESFDRIIADFGSKFSDLSPGNLLSRSRTIEAIATTFNTPETRDEMAADALAMVLDTASSLADLRGLFPSLVKIEAARVAQQMVSADAPAIMQNSAEIIEIARESDVVDQSAVEALEMAVPEFEESQRLIEMAADDIARAAALEKRAEIVSLHVLDIRNFGSSAINAAVPIRFIKGAGKLGKKVAGDLGSDAYSGVRSGVKKGTEKVTEAAVIGGYAALVAALVDPIWGMATYILSMRSIGTKANEIKQERDKASKDQEAETSSHENGSDRDDK